MKRVCLLLALLLLAAPDSTRAQDFDPAAVTRDLRAERAQRTKGAPVAEYARIDADIAAKAKAKLAAVDPAKVDGARARNWAALYTLAEQHAPARDLLQRYLQGSLSEADRFQGQFELMMAAVKLNDGDTIYAQLREIKVTPQNAVSLGSYFGGTFHHYVLNAKGPEACLEIIARLEAAIPDGPFPSDEVRKSNGWARRQLADAKSVYLAESGRYTEALKAIDAAMAALDDDVYRKKDLLGTRRRYELIGQPAPALTVDRWHGDYRGLEAYRGKVLMLEFTAHWCHACHAALPALRKLYAELRDREFEIVSVTTYYGYFYPDNVQKKDMPRDVEFARMPKMLKEQGVTWPMVYTDRATMTAYGVTGIPHLILLDKKGIIRRVDLGFSDAKMGRFKTLLATLLAE